MSAVETNPFSVRRHSWLFPGGLRGWMRRAFWLFCASLTVWLLYDRVGGRIKLQWALLAAQRDALENPEPKDRLIYDGDFDRAQPHLRDGGYEAVSYYRDFGQILDTKYPWAVASSGVQVRYLRLLERMAALSKWNELREIPTISTGGGSRFVNRLATHSQAIFVGGALRWAGLSG